MVINCHTFGDVPRMAEIFGVINSGGEPVSTSVKVVMTLIIKKCQIDPTIVYF